MSAARGDRRSRSVAERIRDVRIVQAAARHVVDRRAELVPRLVASTGLSREGVELALTHHVELDATDADLAQLVAGAGDSPRVTVVLSANVFVGALRAIALARAAAVDVIVKPSRRDPAFALALIEAAAAAGDAHLHVVEELDIAAVDEGEIHVYGHDATVAEIQRKARPDVRVRGHGSGMGVAWVAAGDERAFATAARDLAADVVAFDQRGCLSPRVALVEGDQARAEAFAATVHEALEHLGAVVPRGPLPPDVAAEAARYADTMTYACRAFVGTQHVVGIAPAGAPLALPPPYRHLHVASAGSRASASALLAPLAKGIVAVGSDDLAGARTLAPAWARVSRLGAMQRPPLDGPVDLREV